MRAPFRLSGLIICFKSLNMQLGGFAHESSSRSPNCRPIRRSFCPLSSSSVIRDMGPQGQIEPSTCSSSPTYTFANLCQPSVHRAGDSSNYESLCSGYLRGLGYAMNDFGHRTHRRLVRLADFNQSSYTCVSLLPYNNIMMRVGSQTGRSIV